ncbi:hypothetical protein J6590_037199 [Homalodisca vitripennis]|nr:hypothetical protein J6590_037199 [Homalodisca vitripennis]
MANIFKGIRGDEKATCKEGIEFTINKSPSSSWCIPRLWKEDYQLRASPQPVITPESRIDHIITRISLLARCYCSESFKVHQSFARIEARKLSPLSLSTEEFLTCPSSVHPDPDRSQT